MAFRTNKVPAIEERTVSGSNVSFNSAFALPLKACKVSFSATQASGTPSPSSPLPISGVSAIGLNANSTPVSVSLGDTRYGGVLDVLTGELTITHKRSADISTLSWSIVDTSAWNCFYTQVVGKKAGTTNILCEVAKTTNFYNNPSIDNAVMGNGVNNTVYIRDTSFNLNVNAFKQAYAGYYLYYELATPIVSQLSPTELSTILGNNTFSTDTGTLEITFADLQEKSASGSVASFNTALAMPLVNGEFSIEAYQEGSGDPSPSNVRNIVGFSEVNAVNSPIAPVNKLIPITAKQSGSGNPSPDNVRPITAGLTITRDDDSILEVYGGTLNPISGELTLTHSSATFNGSEQWTNVGGSYPQAFQLNNVVTNAYQGSAINPKNRGDISNIYPWAENDVEQYAIRFQLDDNHRGRIYVYDSNYSSNLSGFVAHLNTTNLKIVYSLYQNITIQLSATELSRAKEALGITSYTKQLGETVYGGSYNSVTGKKIKTHKIIDLSTIPWQYDANKRIFSFTNTGAIPDLKTYVVDTLPPWECEVFKIFKATNFVQSDNLPDLSICPRGNVNLLMVRDLSYTDANLFKQSLQGKYLCYEIATPIESNIGATPISTNIGDNNIFCDTGDTSLVYKDLDIAKRGNFREVFKLPS